MFTIIDEAKARVHRQVIFVLATPRVDHQTPSPRNAPPTTHPNCLSFRHLQYMGFLAQRVHRLRI